MVATTQAHSLGSAEKPPPAFVVAAAPVARAALDILGLRQQLQELTKESGCSFLDVVLLPNGTVRVIGHVRNARDARTVHQFMASLPRASALEAAFKVRPLPFCAILSSLGSHSHGGLELGPGPKGGADVLMDGAPLVVEIKIPRNTSGYLYVAHMDNRGTVTQLVPRSRELLQRVEGGTEFRIDRAADGHPLYSIVPPFGDELVFALLTTAPLFKPERPEAEHLLTYIGILNTALDALPTDSLILTGHYFFRSIPR